MPYAIYIGNSGRDVGALVIAPNGEDALFTSCDTYQQGALAVTLAALETLPDSAKAALYCPSTYIAYLPFHRKVKAHRELVMAIRQEAARLVMIWTYAPSHTWGVAEVRRRLRSHKREREQRTGVPNVADAIRA